MRLPGCGKSATRALEGLATVLAEQVAAEDPLVVRHAPSVLTIGTSSRYRRLRLDAPTGARTIVGPWKRSRAPTWKEHDPA